MMLVIILLIRLSIQGIVPVLTGISILHLFSISFLGIVYISKGLKSKPNKKGTKEGTKEYAIPFKVLSSFSLCDGLYFFYHIFLTALARLIYAECFNSA